MSEAVQQEQQQLPRDRWCVESVGEPLADSRQGDLKRPSQVPSRENQASGRTERLCPVHTVPQLFRSAGGLGVHKRRLHATKS